MYQARKLSDSLSVMGLPKHVSLKYGYYDYFNRSRRSVELPPTKSAVKELKQYWPNPTIDKDQVDWLLSRVNFNPNQALNTPVQSVSSISGLTPYPFQVDSIAYALYARDQLKLKGIRVLLADDPRMGKSIQALSILKNLPEYSKQPVLILCLKSLVYQWYDYCQEWIPEYKPVILQGSKNKREKLLKNSTDQSVLITNWETVRMNLLNKKWWAIIGDEAHKIKNRKAQLSLRVKTLCDLSKHVILLTATPTENTPDEYWHLLHCLNPYDFSNYWRFVGWYCQTRNNGFGIEITGAKNTDCLKEHLAPYVIRRHANEVIDLPEEVYTTIKIDLPNEFRKLYEQAEQEMLIQIAENESIPIVSAGALFARLRQLALHPYTLYTDYEQTAKGKYEALLELVSTLPEHAQAIIFSSFVNGVKLAHNLLASSVLYTGNHKTPGAIETFTNQQAKYFCATSDISAGLNLGCADYVIYLDRPVSSIKWRQSKDRPKLIGKQQSIGIYTIEAKNTIDQYVNRLINHKMNTIEDSQIIKKLLAFYSKK